MICSKVHQNWDIFASVCSIKLGEYCIHILTRGGIYGRICPWARGISPGLNSSNPTRKVRKLFKGFFWSLMSTNYTNFTNFYLPPPPERPMLRRCRTSTALLAGTSGLLLVSGISRVSRWRAIFFFHSCSYFYNPLPSPGLQACEDPSHLSIDPVTVHATSHHSFWYDGQTINMTDL